MARNVVRERPAVAVEPAGRGYSLVRWGPSFAGAVATIALTAMCMALWSALAYGSDDSYFQANLPWYFLGTVLGALLVGGVIAGWATGIWTMGSRLLTGITMWGLAVIAALVPLLLRGLVVAGHVATPGQASTVRIPSDDIWTVFAAIGGGLLCAVAGSVFGGVGGRRVAAARHYEAPSETRPEMAAPPRQQRAG